jgi:hypothetical protein
MIPILTSGCPSRALELAMRRVQASASSQSASREPLAFERGKRSEFSDVGAGHEGLLSGSG